jgi:hypothetical protein
MGFKEELEAIRKEAGAAEPHDVCSDYYACIQYCYDHGGLGCADGCYKKYPCNVAETHEKVKALVEKYASDKK